VREIMSKNKEPQILLDADVIRHFLSGRQLSKLTSIFPDRFVILDKVKNELCRSQRLVKDITGFIDDNNIPVVALPTNLDIIREYSVLKKSYGEGESACMAVARFDNKYIASSNLKDIKTYCETNSITYYTTMDLLVKAVDSEILTEAEADYFIYNVKTSGSKLPCNSIAEYKTKINKT
jgi:hypothetical protein